MFLFGLVVAVALPIRRARRRDGRHESLLRLGAVERRLEVVDVGLELRHAAIGDGRGADHVVLARGHVAVAVELREGFGFARARHGLCRASLSNSKPPRRSLTYETKLGLPYSPSSMISMPRSICLRTTSATAARRRAAWVFSSMGLPSSLARTTSSRSAGRGRLPTWVVRTRSMLRFMVPPAAPRCQWRAYITSPITTSPSAGGRW